MMIVRSVALIGFAALCSCGQATTSAAAIPTTVPTDAATTTLAERAPAAPAAAPSAAALTENASAEIEAGAAPSSAATINSNVVASLKSELVGVGKLDGQPITDVTAQGKCETAFRTASGSVVVHWAKVGNFAGTVDHGTASIPIDDGAGAHTFAMPETPTFRRVNGSFGLLADNCQG